MDGLLKKDFSAVFITKQYQRRTREGQKQLDKHMHEQDMYSNRLKMHFQYTKGKEGQEMPDKVERYRTVLELKYEGSYFKQFVQ